ncbi:MAG: glycosyltransferase family 2 protein [Acidobacteriota bacterium]|nr:glycosyltransferase family 2 protein [Acidobacteriota bacterium]
MTVSAILVNYNDRSHLGPCLDSLWPEMSGPGDEIIVVDNASTDGSREMLAAGYPGVRVLALAENAGFAKANNLGIRESRGGYLFFLNTDTIVRPFAVRRLVATLESQPGAGACAPALVHPGGRFQVSFGGEVNFFGQIVQKTILNPWSRRSVPRRTKPHDAAWLSAACLLARREAVDRVGGFDEAFFIYFEDIDLCRRIREAGWRLIFDPRVQIQHVGGATTSSRLRRSRLEYRRSQLRFYDKHASAVSRSLLRAVLRTSLAWKSARGEFRDAEGREIRRLYRAMLRRKEKSA